MNIFIQLQKLYTSIPNASYTSIPYLAANNGKLTVEIFTSDALTSDPLAIIEYTRLRVTSSGTVVGKKELAPAIDGVAGIPIDPDSVVQLPQDDQPLLLMRYFKLLDKVITLQNTNISYPDMKAIKELFLMLVPPEVAEPYKVICPDFLETFKITY